MKATETKTHAADNQKIVIGAKPAVWANVKPKSAGPMMADLGRKDYSKLSLMRDS
jgi:hypothetical protein